jgi:hypothetical protein
MSDDYYFKNIDVIKYNYKNFQKRNTNLCLKFNNSNRQLVSIHYKSRNGKQKPITNMIGIIYGTRTTTFEHIDYCIPWLCISMVRHDRTYDFQFKHHYQLIWFLYHTKILGNHTISQSLPQAILKISLEMPIKEDETYVIYFYRLLKHFKSNEYAKMYKIKNKSIECPICLDIKSPVIILKKCHHKFCKTCIDSHIDYSMKHTNKLACPLCRMDLV